MQLKYDSIRAFFKKFQFIKSLLYFIAFAWTVFTVFYVLIINFDEDKILEVQYFLSPNSQYIVFYEKLEKGWFYKKQMYSLSLIHRDYHAKLKFIYTSRDLGVGKINWEKDSESFIVEKKYPYSHGEAFYVQEIIKNKIDRSYQ